MTNDFVMFATYSFTNSTLWQYGSWSFLNWYSSMKKKVEKDLDDF